MTEHKKYLSLCEIISLHSNDPNKKVGCLILNSKENKIVWGYNKLPEKLEALKSKFTSKEAKNSLMIHAEIDAITNAKLSLKDATLYVNYPPCDKCALTIINAGISTVITMTPNLKSSWINDINRAIYLFEVAGVNYVHYSDLEL